MLASADPGGTALTVVSKDRTETTLTWDGLERAANRWAHALQSASVGRGAMVALSIPNSIELVLAALAAWKVGAVPVPMRWDLPEWEQQRLLDVIDAALVLGEANLAAMADAARREDDAALPEVVSPVLNGICSSGSTGLPKIILNTGPPHGHPSSASRSRRTGRRCPAADDPGARAHVPHQRLQSRWSTCSAATGWSYSRSSTPQWFSTSSSGTA